MVYDGTGDGAIKYVESKIAVAREAGYAVKVQYVTVDTDEAVVRNVNRYENVKAKWDSASEEKRAAMLPPCLPPEGMVRDTHAKVSMIAPQVADKFALFELYDNRGYGETCVLLVRESISDDEMVSIKVDLDGISLDQGRYVPPAKPTYKNIKQWIFDKYGFNVSTLYIAQIKDKVGLEKRKNYNPGSGEGKVPVCPPEKEKAIMDAFRHFNLI